MFIQNYLNSNTTAETGNKVTEQTGNKEDLTVNSKATYNMMDEVYLYNKMIEENSTRNIVEYAVDLSNEDQMFIIGEDKELLGAYKDNKYVDSMEIIDQIRNNLGIAGDFNTNIATIYKIKLNKDHNTFKVIDGYRSQYESKIEYLNVVQTFDGAGNVYHKVYNAAFSFDIMIAINATHDLFPRYSQRVEGKANQRTIDIDGDGKDELATSSKEKDGVVVKVQNSNGETLIKYSEDELVRFDIIDFVDINGDGVMEMLAGKAYSYPSDYFGIYSIKENKMESVLQASSSD